LCDSGRLRQVLINLGGNAIKFTDSGSIVIRFGPAGASHGGLWELAVIDTGPGLSDEQQVKIFEPFVQGDLSSSRRHGGTGLGLAISRRLVELMGGTLSVASRPGGGSKFVARLPMASGQERKMEAAPSPGVSDGKFASLHPLRILVAEDDAINLKLTLTLLAKLGYDAISASNGREAVEQFAGKLPNCIIMDLQMPEMDGIEATIAIREMERASGRPPVHIVALTANTDAGDRQRCLDAGVSAHVNKPVRRERLCEILAMASKALRDGQGA
jgi:CheY-like chemotaxis protein